MFITRRFNGAVNNINKPSGVTEEAANTTALLPLLSAS